MSRIFLLAAVAPGLMLTVLAGCDSGSDAGAGSPGAGGPGGPGGAPPALPVQVAVAERVPFEDTIDAVGALRSPETTVIAADAQGLLTYLDAPEGRPVKKGRLLARLDDTTATATLKVMEARLTNAEAVLERIEPLWKQGVLSRQDYDDAVAERDTALGLVEEAKTRKGKAEVFAPFDGVIGIQTAQTGQYLSSGDPIVQLTRVDPLELIFAVPEEEATQVRLGQTVRGRVGRCGQMFEGTVEAIDPSLDIATRTLQVQARVPNPERVLRPGMSARVSLIVDTGQEALFVPQEALAVQGTRYLVWVVQEDDTVAPRPVVPGRYLPDKVEIASGLQSGERVVAAGWQKLRPGAPVQAMPWQPTDNPLLDLGRSRFSDCTDSETAPASSPPGTTGDGG